MLTRAVAQGGSTLDLDAVWAPDQPLPEDLILAKADQQAVQLFRGQLSAVEQRFMRARFMEGLSQRHAADATDLTRQRVRTLERDLLGRFVAYWKTGTCLSAFNPGRGAAAKSRWRNP